MKAAPISLALAAALAVGTGASAQTYSQSYDAWRAQQSTYNQQNAAYQDRREDYEAQRQAYEASRSRYQSDRAAYDTRWGVGSYERRYGAFVYTPAPYAAGDYGYNAAATDPYYAYRNSECERRQDNNQVAGGIIGALAGAALGSNVAARGVRTEGAVLGAVVGGALGANIGKSSARCDDRGYYYSFDQTRPYRENSYDRRRNSGRYNYSWYSRNRCRLAPAPASYGGATEYRYVRVCPDGMGRYRITG